jgi:peptide/nickel transport system substrate-binding protein
MLADTAAGVHALLEGRIDFLQELPYDWIDQLERAPGIPVVRTPWIHTARLGMDQGSQELRSSNIKGQNPFEGRRVRQAMQLAIDVERLAENTLSGLAVPARMLIPPPVNGFFAELADQRLYDPERTKALLAEAGYPEGFEVALDCREAWSLLRDDKVCRAVAAMLGEIGIQSRREIPARQSLHREGRRPAKRLLCLRHRDGVGFAMDSRRLAAQ